MKTLVDVNGNPFIKIYTKKAQGDYPVHIQGKSYIGLYRDNWYYIDNENEDIVFDADRGVIYSTVVGTYYLDPLSKDQLLDEAQFHLEERVNVYFPDITTQGKYTWIGNAEYDITVCCIIQNNQVWFSTPKPFDTQGKPATLFSHEMLVLPSSTWWAKWLKSR